MKIYEQGLDSASHQWGSDLLFINKGYVNTTIPSCIKAGQYLLRVEYICEHFPIMKLALHLCR